MMLPKDRPVVDTLLPTNDTFHVVANAGPNSDYLCMLMHAYHAPAMKYVWIKTAHDAG